MKKTIFEELGGTYVRCGDYFIPNLTLPEEEEPRFVGVWGQRHLQYLKEYWSGNTMRNCVHGKIRQNRRKKSNQNRRKRQAYGKNYTAISRKVGNSQNKLQRKNLWTENDEKGGKENEENNF